MERAVGRFEADDAEVFFGEAFDIGREGTGSRLQDGRAEVAVQDSRAAREEAFTTRVVGVVVAVHRQQTVVVEGFNLLDGFQRRGVFRAPAILAIHDVEGADALIPQLRQHRPVLAAVVQIKRNELIAHVARILFLHVAQVCHEFVVGQGLNRRPVIAHRLCPVAAIREHVGGVEVDGVAVLNLGEGVQLAIDAELVEAGVAVDELFQIRVRRHVVRQRLEHALFHPFEVLILIQVVPRDDFRQTLGVCQRAGGFIPRIPRDKLDFKVEVELLHRLLHQRPVEHVVRAVDGEDLEGQVFGVGILFRQCGRCSQHDGENHCQRQNQR